MRNKIIAVLLTLSIAVAGISGIYVDGSDLQNNILTVAGLGMIVFGLWSSFVLWGLDN